MTEAEIKAARESFYESKKADLTLRIANAQVRGELTKARKLEAEMRTLNMKFAEQSTEA